MPLDTSIPLQTKTADINPLATMLQVGQYKYLQQNSNRLQMDTDANQAVGQAIQRNTGKDGSVNLLAVQRDLSGDPAAAYNLQGATGTNLSQQGQQISNGSAQIEQQGKQLALTSDQQAHMAQQLGTLLGKKDLSYSDMVHTAASAGEMYGLPPTVIQKSVAAIPNDPAQWKQYIQSRLASLQAPGAQLTSMTPTPTLTTNGATDTYRDTNAITNPGIVGTTFDRQIGPGQQETTRTDVLGNPYIEQRAPSGGITGTRAVPNSYSAVSGAPQQGPAVMPPGGAGMIDDAQKEVSAARAAANNAPAMHDLNRQIIAEADKNFATGKLGSFTQSLASRFGYQLSGDDATSYNTLGKLLERSAIQAAQGMGPHTNAGLESARAGNGTLDYDKTTIRKIAVLNDALVSGAEHYRSGLEHALDTSGQNPAVKRVYDQAWAKNFDPRIMRLMNAKQSGDTKEASAVIQEVGGQNSKGARDLANKAHNLNLLIQQGHL